MTLSDTFFNSHRFWLTAKKEWRENRNQILLGIFGFFGCLILILCWIAHLTYRGYAFNENIISEDPFIVGTNTRATFGIFALVFGLFLGSSIMNNMGTKVGRINCLMNPATQFEKYMVRWIYVTIFSCIIFIGMFIIADLIRVWVFSTMYPNITGIHPISITYIFKPFNNETSEFSWNTFFFLITCYWCIQSFFILASTIWPKKGIKGLAAIIILGATYTYAFAKFCDIFMCNLQFSSLQHEIDPILLISIGYLIIAITNWVLAYYRFKESEIIQRM